MTITLEQLRTPATEDEALETLIGYLSAVGFNSSSWHSGSLQRQFLRMFAVAYADMTTFIAAVAGAAYNETATGDALTAFSLSHYQNTRTEAVAAVGSMVLSNSGVVPYAIGVGEVVVAYSTPTGDEQVTFRNTTGGTLAAGGTLTISVTADVPGADGNVPTDTDLYLVTALAGVTVTNPALAGTETWLTTTGSDQETDAALRVRNATRWATRSTETIADTVLNICLNAAAGIEKVSVNDQNPRGAGTFDVYLAGLDDTASSGDVAAALAALEARFFGSDRVRCYAASETAIGLTGTIYYASGHSSAQVEQAVDAALDAFFESIPLGGFDFTPGPTRVVPRDELDRAIRNATIGGESIVRLVALTAPSGDTSISAHQLVVRGTDSLTYTAVA